MNKRSKRLLTTKGMSTIAILAAVASVLFVLEIPVVLFYKLDFSNLPVLLGTFAMGPLAGVLILGVKSLIGLLHTTSQGVGELADFLIGCAMVLPVGLFYRRRRTRDGALMGMALGTLAATAVGVLSNVYIMIPFYGAVYHMPVEQIVAMGHALVPAIDSVWEFIFYITAPFNLLKWMVLSALSLLMYKPLSPILHGMARQNRPIKEQTKG